MKSHNTYDHNHVNPSNTNYKLRLCENDTMCFQKNLQQKIKKSMNLKIYNSKRVAKCTAMGIVFLRFINSLKILVYFSD